MIRLNVTYRDYEITVFDNTMYSTVLIQEPLPEPIQEDSVPNFWIGRKHQVEALFDKPLNERSEMEEVLCCFFADKIVHMNDLLPQEFNLSDYEFLDEEDDNLI
jgi:hypothetical protein